MAIYSMTQFGLFEDGSIKKNSAVFPVISGHSTRPHIPWIRFNSKRPGIIPHLNPI